MLYYDHLDTPIGPLLLVGDGEGLVYIGLPRHGAAQPASPDATASKPKLHAAARELDEYFAGMRRQFDVPLRPSGTPFQLEVWGALLTIPYGETVSYADIARRIRRPRAVRAVGAANGANPLSIIVPCHRVIGSHGDLTGYGGGLPAKRWLLAHERKHAPVPSLTLTA
ncbi:MAG: methylated-DNA--[protein]-cysteine S-methyltransferase [Xanthomonadaceae bacterium]|nr:methylated-DNA--[protein]-cysteine S-methyltransferase [Xanthomonadaceae bacterium]MDE2053278.1 methylated-DNA--[protein]-cysteine S-methyltransferase [Xanthomonadaceae bacterium]MDE2225082.1 methylated-DNA--[protein]-cysteine S-methyltransferase [Xanthomonadaceae bacterium]MDE2496651.1 methylated-DNA--[protein]-cysteine S-methyltransferase [Xanthomonadaceae bacterium]